MHRFPECWAPFNRAVPLPADPCEPVEPIVVQPGFMVLGVFCGNGGSRVPLACGQINALRI